MQRWLQWEFWPARLFYIPIGLNYVRLGLKYRGFNLPTIANPGMLTGGLVGESKHAILQDLFDTSPDFTARSALIGRGRAGCADGAVRASLPRTPLQLPVVLKPNIAHRGSGFRLVRTPGGCARISRAASPAMWCCRNMPPGPCEIGIFYYRFPQEERGPHLRHHREGVS